MTARDLLTGLALSAFLLLIVCGYSIAAGAA